MKARDLLIKHNLHESSWGKRIVLAEISGEFDSLDLYDSKFWFSCACGKLDEKIPRLKDKPKDRMLVSLGYRFSDMVEQNLFSLAAQTLIEIEERGNKILKRKVR